MNMQNYIDLICEALDRVPKEYYKIPTVCNEKIRERAFCYELYHQMRKYQEQYCDERNDLSLIIHGEIDKRGWVGDFEDKNPDFIFHQPGINENNYIIMEVKNNYNDIERVKKDFKTLTIFMESGHYQCGIFLIYNYSWKELCFRLKQIKFDFKEYRTDIKIFCKKNVGSCIEKHTMAELVSAVNG